MKPIYILLLLSLFYGKAIAQASDPYFIESKDVVSKYAPDHITRDMLQDMKGHYWFATWLGIVEYDGEVFTNHTLKDDLIHFHVICCYEDSKGNLWFGTARGGLYCYDGQHFKLFTTKDGLVDNNIGCITEDKVGNIWIGTEHGASRYDGRAFKNFNSKNGLTDEFVNSIIQDKAGKVWFGATWGLYVMDDKMITKKKDVPIKRITSLLEDNKGGIWIGGFEGLVRYNARPNDLVGRGKTYTSFFPDLLTYYIIEDKKGNILFTHSENNPNYNNIPTQVLYKYDGKVLKKIASKGEPNDFQVFGKMEDKDGNIWFGTMHGPCRYDVRPDGPVGRGKAFTYFTK